MKANDIRQEEINNLIDEYTEATRGGAYVDRYTLAQFWKEANNEEEYIEKVKLYLS